MDLSRFLDSANTSLYQSVSQQFDIRLVENQDWREEVWHSFIQDRSAVIYYCQSDHPQAHFSRELLYLDLHNKGFREIKTAISLDKSIQAQLSVLIKILNRYAALLKMAPTFLALGYRPEQFLEEGGDGDATADFILGQLEEKGRSLLSLSLLYLSFSEPLVVMQEAKRVAVRNAFIQYAEGSYRSHFEEIDQLSSQWQAAASVDPEPFFRSLLTLLQPTKGWFSYRPDLPGFYEQHFPQAGFFIGDPFTAQQIQHVYGR